MESEKAILHVRTNKNIIGDMPRFAFNGRIEVVQSKIEMEKAVDYLKRRKLLGIDTETKPQFKAGPRNKVALLQIGDEKICFLFRLNFIGMPAPLVDLLNDENVTKVGLSLGDDLRQLSHRSKTISSRSWIDLQPLAKSMGIEDMSLRKLFANFFGQRISKTAQLSNWEAQVLNDQQKVYAATDAYACIVLYRRMMELKENGFELIQDDTDDTTQAG